MTEIEIKPDLKSELSRKNAEEITSRIAEAPVRTLRQPSGLSAILFNYRYMIIGLLLVCIIVMIVGYFIYSQRSPPTKKLETAGQRLTEADDPRPATATIKIVRSPAKPAIEDEEEMKKIAKLNEQTAHPNGGAANDTQNNTSADIVSGNGSLSQPEAIVTDPVQIKKQNNEYDLMMRGLIDKPLGVSK